MVHQDDRARVNEFVARALATFEPQEDEWRVVWPDASIHWLCGRFQAFKDQNGKSLRLAGINLDITARKAIEMSLRESEARANAVLNTAADAIVTIDERGTIQSANLATERLFGYAPAELIGQNINMLMPQPYQGEHDQYLQQYLATGVKKVIGIGREVQGRRKDGSIFPVDLAVSEVALVGRRLFTGIVRDLTERKTAEKELEGHHEELAHILRLNTMGEMAAGLAHELNQPLSAIANFARGTARRLHNDLVDKPAIIEAVNAIADEAVRASEIIHCLNRHVKKSVAQRFLIEINVVVRDAARVVASEAKSRGVAVRLCCAPKLPKIDGDAVQLEQIVINLLRNGFDALDVTHGEKLIVVETKLSAAGGVEVSVVDNGCGLAPGIAGNIFDAFFTTKSHGLGMGLAISRTMIEAHGGLLWAEPNPGSGTAFRFTLPPQRELRRKPIARDEAACLSS